MGECIRKCVQISCQTYLDPISVHFMQGGSGGQSRGGENPGFPGEGGTVPLSRNPGQKGTLRNIALFFRKITIKIVSAFNFWTFNNLSLFSFAQNVALL